MAPASPGKAERLRPFLAHQRGTLYVNLEEAGLLCQDRFTDSETAAHALLSRGAARVLVTDGGQSATEADASGARTQVPPRVTVARVTGAGDTFMAAHIAAEARSRERARLCPSCRCNLCIRRTTPVIDITYSAEVEAANAGQTHCCA